MPSTSTNRPDNTVPAEQSSEQTPPATGLWAAIRSGLGIDGPKYNEVLPPLAQRLGGTFHDGGHAWGSHVDFPYKDANISIHTGSTAAGRAAVSRTTVTLEFADKKPFDMEVSPDGRIPKLYETVMRIRDLFPGDSEFDAAVTVHGNPEDAVRRVLGTPEIQEYIMAERSLMISTVPDAEHAHGFIERYLGVTAPDGKRQITIRLPFEVMNTERLYNLALLARALYDQVEALPA